jgi:hypothetical protein
VRAADADTYSVVITNAAGQPAVFRANLQVLSGQPLLTQLRKLSDGTFGMLLLGLTNQVPYTVEFSSNLSNWMVLTTLTATNWSVPFVDVTSLEATQRFYRARSGP